MNAGTPAAGPTGRRDSDGAPADGPRRDRLHRDRAPRDRAHDGLTDHALELVLSGLAPDEDALLGDLAEGRADVAATSGERASRRWWRHQAVLALPRLVWHGLAHRPSAWLLGLAGFVTWEVLTTMVPAPFGTDIVVYDALHPVAPAVGHVWVDTVVVGLGTLAAAVAAGAGTAALARRARLLPVLVTAALMVLISTRHGFYVVLGPGRCVWSDDDLSQTCGVELGAGSVDAVIPTLWQLPTQMALLPVAVVAGALAVVARHRGAGARGEAPAPDR